MGAYRSATAIFPTVVPDIAYGLLWLWLLNPLYGPINTLPRLGRRDRTPPWIGYPLPQWLTHPNDARAAIIILSLFTIGEGFVVLLVTRQGLPTELYDLAALEDVTSWGLFRRVTLPLMAPVLAAPARAGHDLQPPGDVRPGARRHRGWAAALLDDVRAALRLPERVRVPALRLRRGSDAADARPHRAASSSRSSRCYVATGWG